MTFPAHRESLERELFVREATFLCGGDAAQAERLAADCAKAAQTLPWDTAADLREAVGRALVLGWRGDTWAGARQFLTLHQYLRTTGRTHHARLK